MTEKQELLLAFLKYFDRLCKENDIQYFLAGGSMLGAVRHGGFLPWDDDADLYITNSQLQRALPIFVDKLDTRYSVEALESKRDCANTIVRIVDKETCEYHRSRLADNTAHGIYLELFRLDPVPESKLNDDSYYRDFWVYCEGLSKYNGVATPTLDLSKLNLDDYLKFQKELDRGDREQILMEKEKDLFSYNEKVCARYHERWGHYWLVYPKDAFKEQLYIPFEDTMLPVPIGFADILYGEYGDNWMEIPDIKDRAIHPGVENYHVPYRKYDEDIFTRLDKKNFLSMTLEKKVNRVEAVFYQYGIRLERLKAQNRLLSMQLNNAETVAFCSEAIANRDYTAVLEKLRKYTDAQREAYGDNYCFAMDKELIFSAAFAKLMVGDIRWVERLKQNLKEVTDDRLKALFEDIPEIRRLRFSYYYGKLTDENNLMALSNMLAKYPDQLNLRELFLLSKLHDIGYRSNDDTRVLEAVIVELRSLYPNRYRLQKLEADLMLCIGKTQEAYTLYETILDTSNDGMVNKEIRALLKSK